MVLYALTPVGLGSRKPVSDTETCVHDGRKEEAKRISPPQSPSLLLGSCDVTGRRAASRAKVRSQDAQPDVLITNNTCEKIDNILITLVSLMPIEHCKIHVALTKGQFFGPEHIQAFYWSSVSGRVLPAPAGDWLGSGLPRPSIAPRDNVSRPY